MLILAVDTATSVNGCALWLDGKILRSVNEKSGLTHSQRLIPNIDVLLKGAGVKLGDVGYFACAVGPGSYTGIRIGTATIKAFAQVTNTPCVAVNSLYSLAFNVDAPFICSMIDARHNEVYAAMYDEYKNCILPPRAIFMDELLPLLERKTVWFVGDGALVHQEKLRSVCEAGFAANMFNDASSLCFAAERLINAGEVCDYKTLTPVYLKLTQAEMERKAREIKH